MPGQAPNGQAPPNAAGVQAWAVPVCAALGVSTWLAQAVISALTSGSLLNLWLLSLVRWFAGVTAITPADVAVYCTVALFFWAIAWPTVCRLTHVFYPETAKALQLPKGQRAPPLRRRLLTWAMHVCVLLCLFAAMSGVRFVVELMRATPASRGPTAAPFRFDATRDGPQQRAEAGETIGVCARQARACALPVASPTVVRRLLHCVHEYLTASTPAYSGPACSIEEVMQQVDLDHDRALNTTERDRALQHFVPDHVYDPELLSLIACG